MNTKWKKVLNKGSKHQLNPENSKHSEYVCFLLYVEENRSTAQYKSLQNYIHLTTFSIIVFYGIKYIFELYLCNIIKVLFVVICLLIFIDKLYSTQKDLSFLRLNDRTRSFETTRVTVIKFCYITSMQL